MNLHRQIGFPKTIEFITAKFLSCIAYRSCIPMASEPERKFSGYFRKRDASPCLRRNVGLMDRVKNISSPVLNCLLLKKAVLLFFCANSGPDALPDRQNQNGSPSFSSLLLCLYSFPSLILTVREATGLSVPIRSDWKQLRRAAAAGVVPWQVNMCVRYSSANYVFDKKEFQFL